MATLKEKTAKGFLWGAMNNSAMQILNMIFGVVLGRLLSKEDYGLIGMMVIFTSIAAALQDSGFVTALTNRKNATHVDYNSVFWFNIGVSAGIYCLFFLGAPLLSSFYDEPLLTPLFRYYSLCFLAASFSIVPRAMLFKQLRQKELAVISTVSLLVSGIVGISMAFAGMAYWGLATQSLVYTLTVSGISWIISGWRPSLDITVKPVREMFGFSSRMLLTNIFQQVNNNIFAVILGKMYSKSEVGIYNQANKWNTMGASVITGMVQGVAQPAFVEIGDDKERLCRAFSKMLRFTCIVSFPVCFGLALVAPEFIVILITEKWLPSAFLMQTLCIGGAFLPVSALYYNMVISRGKSNIYMWNITCQGITMLSAILAIHLMGGSITDMVGTYVAVIILWTAIWHYFVWREIGFSALQAVKDILPFILIAGMTMLITRSITCGIDSILLLLTARIGIAAVIYAALLWMFRAEEMKECLSFLRRKKT
ncbi:MAG: lipopolysaccharide biosynthesis protein [Bacteroidales bacterium]|nr:lipopolysaccharide biosynthesis protein [Bacteroidales bacterium]MCM1148366.1 lipopolysaccharide biosynthesis protein [Bacteroidales bacterium]MCM1207039.1 lipopolysaccharide biosynthesis protein [Bacillota bacterium]MCM1511310.1 lipopolysaccharide biosynthesis protein [Clostridium sp.]